VKFYQVWGRNDPNAGIGELPEGFDCLLTVKEAHEQIKHPILTVTHGTLLDFLPSAISWHIVSRKTRTIFDAYKLPDDTFDWHSVEVRYKGMSVPYYAIWFPEHRDVLKQEECSFVPGTHYLRRIVLSSEKLRAMTVTTVERGDYSGRWFIAEELKKAIERHRCTGFVFEKANLDGIIRRRSRKIDVMFHEDDLEQDQRPVPSFISNLPIDLREFLESRGKLKYNAADCEAGAVVLKDLSQLSLATISVIPNGKQSANAYRVQAVSLTHECEGYDPEFILLWMPNEQLYGSWDADHSRLLVFPLTKWTDIVQNPIPYLNSQWDVHSDVAAEY
jgi:hypothetical protein